MGEKEERLWRKFEKERERGEKAKYRYGGDSEIKTTYGKRKQGVSYNRAN